MTDDIYRPSPWQQEFHALRVHEALGAGAAGVGKSLCLLMDPMEQVIVEHQRCADSKHPYHIRKWGNSTGWALHLRRELGELEQTIARSQVMFPGMDKQAHYRRDTHTWTFSSGFKYQFGHCKDADDHIKYLSNQYTHISFDELTTFSKLQYDGITARIRSSDPVLRRMLKVRSMSNPGVSPGAEPHWVRRLFVDPALEGRKVLAKRLKRKDGTAFTRTRIYLPGKLSDNPDKQFAQDYEEVLTDKPAHIRKAYLDGDWYFRPGSFFGEDFDRRLHVVRPFAIPSDWPVFRAMDWGFKTKGNIGWYAMDPDGDLFKIEEFTFIGLEDFKVAKEVEHIEKRLRLWDEKKKRSRITGPADTQLWENRGDSGKSKAQVFLENGVPWEQADKKSRATNSQRLIKRLRSHNGGTTNPGIMFFENCKYTISTLPQIDTDQNDPEQPLKGGDDHAVDETLYAAAKASHGSTRIHVVRESEDFDEDEEEQTSDRGRYGYGCL